jgi:glycosyltransferase involved in cell wall biosynthesis
MKTLRQGYPLYRSLEESSVDLSIVIPSYNGAQRAPVFLPRLVRELNELSVTGEVVFVDNGSSDGTAAIARDAAPSAKVVRVDVNRGSAGGRNAGVRVARGRWVLLCDDDVGLEPGCLRALWGARKEEVCLVPRLHDLRGELQNAITVTWSRGDLKFVEHAEPVANLAYPVSACMLLERHVYWAAGGFDERYQPNVYEDTAFGFALRERDTEIQMVTGAVAVNHVHDESRSVDQHRAEFRHRIYKNRWLFNLLVLRGWRRWVAVALGLPRTVLESMRVRSTAPVVGYVKGCGAWATDLLCTWRGTKSA